MMPHLIFEYFFSQITPVHCHSLVSNHTEFIICFTNLIKGVISLQHLYFGIKLASSVTIKMQK